MSKDRDIGKTRKNAKSQGTLHEIAEFAKTVFWAGLIALFLRTLTYEPFNIPSGSMIPTLLVGDYLFVSKFSYGYGEYSFPFDLIHFDGRLLGTPPQRGDVVVFRPPGEPEVDFIKRVIGLPGDRIQMKSGILYINGEAVKRERIEDYIDKDDRFSGPIPQYIETLPNGVSHRIIELAGDEGELDNTPTYVVPDGHYFMMGDNRDGSNDSRPWDRLSGIGVGDEITAANAKVLDKVGFVPYGNLIGPAKILFWSYGPQTRWYNPMSWVSGLRLGRVFDFVE